MAQDISNYGLFIPTTYIFDIEQLKEIKADSQEFKELIVRLYQTINNIILSLNIKDSGYYLNQQFVTGSLFFNTNNNFTQLRPVYRTVVNFGTLPDNTTKSIAHGITNLGTSWSLVRLDVLSTNPDTTSIHIPGFDPSDITKPINAWFDTKNVTIQTKSNMTAYTTTWVIIEYILL
ncbi:MAG TPA: hypothetical protein VHA52_02300 [Candidatus Babeliaceae bacterium]|nr:hypothetical protein [Candidatus Babeliaceae bacterium]